MEWHEKGAGLKLGALGLCISPFIGSEHDAISVQFRAGPTEVFHIVMGEVEVKMIVEAYHGTLSGW